MVYKVHTLFIRLSYISVLSRKEKKVNLNESLGSGQRITTIFYFKSKALSRKAVTVSPRSCKFLFGSKNTATLCNFNLKTPSVYPVNDGMNISSFIFTLQIGSYHSSNSMIDSIGQYEQVLCQGKAKKLVDMH